MAYDHPLCPNTWRNGKSLGDEPPGSYQERGGPQQTAHGA
jgi:hypothetical protein